MDDYEKIIRPIVEGQIRGFLIEHPVVAHSVDWYKPRADKATTFVNSLSKRIVRDLCSEETRLRVVDGLCSSFAVALRSAANSDGAGARGGTALLSDCGIAPAADPDRVAPPTTRSEPSRNLLPQIQWVAS